MSTQEANYRLELRQGSLGLPIPRTLILVLCASDRRPFPKNELGSAWDPSSSFAVLSPARRNRRSLTLAPIDIL